MEKEIKKVFYKQRKLKFNKLLKLNGFSMIPSGYIIDKVRPGIGATHSEIIAPRHSIIIEPFISVMEVKEETSKKPICIVYQKTSNDEIEEYLENDSIIYKKIMVTPESYKRLIRILKHKYPNYLNEFFFLFDECEKLVQHGIFRPDLQMPLEDLFLAKGKALITATPIIPSDKRFEEHGFKILEFRPTFNYKNRLKLITTTNLKTSFRNQLSFYRDNNPVFVFTNCKKSILYATQLEEVNGNYKIFCTKDLDEDFFQHQGIKEVEYSVRKQEYAKYNFFTSRFFSAVDMLLPDRIKPHVIILTDLPYVKHSIIDPATDAIQIFGRLRKGVSSFTHITNLFIHRDYCSPSAIDDEIKFNLKLIDKLNQAQLDFKSREVNNVIEALIGHVPIPHIDEEYFKVNSYTYDAFKNIKVVENCYVSAQVLIDSYVATNFFTVNHIDVKHNICDLDYVKLSKSTGRLKRQKIAHLIHELVSCHIENDKPWDEESFKELTFLKEEDELTYELYFKVGIEELSKTGFALTKMQKLYFNNVIQQRENDISLMVDRILFEFPLNVRLDSTHIKQKLQSIYEENSYFKSYQKVHIAKAKDILKYFEGKYIEPKKPSSDGTYSTYYVLTASKYNLSPDLKLIA